MPPRSMPAAEVVVTAELVRDLIASQHPEFSGLAVRELANGWDNVLFRLGEDLLVRMPRRGLGASLVAREQRWLPALAPALPLAVPAPVRTGEPGPGYPWSWSIVPFAPGRIAAVDPPADPVAAARTLGSFLKALHVPAPPDAPPNPSRGGPLAGRAGTDMVNLDALAGRVDRAAVLRTHRDGVTSSGWQHAPVWLHGDLHPANVIVSDGRVSAVIDFGDLTSGDPATDLAICWMMLPAAARAEFRAAYGHTRDEALWRRTRGWALAFALVYLAHSADHAVMTGIGERTLAAVMAESAHARDT